MVLREPTDVLAAIAVAFGFVPSESVTLLALGGDRPLHARVDLPEDPADLDEALDLLAAPLERLGAALVALVVFTADLPRGDRAAAGLLARTGACGARVLDVLVADGQRFHSALPSADSTRQPYDLGSHRLVAAAVLDGEVVLSSREELARSVAADPAAREGVEVALAELSAASGPMIRSTEQRWVRQRVAGLVRRGRSPDDRTAARIMRAVAVGSIRFVLVTDLELDSAPEWVELWRDLTRRAPEEVAAPVAAVLGVSAWVAGNGALAWCAWDRAVQAPGWCPLTDVLSEVQARAVPPTRWPGVRDTVRAWAAAEGLLAAVDPDTAAGEEVVLRRPAG